CYLRDKHSSRALVHLLGCLRTYDAYRNFANCTSLLVGDDEHRLPVKSLRHVRREIIEYILPSKKCLSTTRLYIIGRWNFSFDHDKELEQALDEARTITFEEDEWNQGGDLVCDLIRNLPNLKELTWITTDFPFTEHVWDVLPTNLTKFVLDIGQPVKVHPADFGRQTYISRNAMQPLTRFTKLEELRLFNMRDSFQSIVWETIFRTSTDNKMMRLLDLQMAAEPMVREKHHWVEASCVDGSRGVNNSATYGSDAYKGQDGRGTLYHHYGYGEYLDYMTIRKARQASGPDKTRAVPLLCLKLDGFVVDHHPFVGDSSAAIPELSSLNLLVCGSKCIDAGFRAPRSTSPSKAWDHMVENATTHCVVDWPTWTGIFDADGRQLDSKGKLVDPDQKENGQHQPTIATASVVKDLTGPFKQLAITTRPNLSERQMSNAREDRNEASRLHERVSDRDLRHRTATPDPDLLFPATPLSRVSNASIRGSPIPTSGSTYFSMMPSSTGLRGSFPFNDMGANEAMKAKDSSLDNISSASTFGDSEDPQPSAADSTVPDTSDKEMEDDGDWEHVNRDEFLCEKGLANL
ncbi:hypothetical protein BDV96DRAFT_218792, partial [Lophiotrema nucula]